MLSNKYYDKKGLLCKKKYETFLHKSQQSSPDYDHGDMQNTSLKYKSLHQL